MMLQDRGVRIISDVMACEMKCSPAWLGFPLHGQSNNNLFGLRIVFCVLRTLLNHKVFIFSNAQELMHSWLLLASHASQA